MTAPRTDDDTQTAPDTATDATNVDTATEAAAEDDTARTGEDVDGGKLRREAARYRRQLRDTEAERDGLRGRLDVMQRAEVERLAADDLDKPADLWVLGTALPDLLDDDGNVDAARVSETVQKIVAERPGWRRTRAVSFDGGARPSAPAAGPSWADTLRQHS